MRRGGRFGDDPSQPDYSPQKSKKPEPMVKKTPIGNRSFTLAQSQRVLRYAGAAAIAGGLLVGGILCFNDPSDQDSRKASEVTLESSASPSPSPREMTSEREEPADKYQGPLSPTWNPAGTATPVIDSWQDPLSSIIKGQPKTPYHGTLNVPSGEAAQISEPRVAQPNYSWQDFLANIPGVPPQAPYNGPIISTADVSNLKAKEPAVETDTQPAPETQVITGKPEEEATTGDNASPKPEKAINEITFGPYSLKDKYEVMGEAALWRAIDNSTSLTALAKEFFEPASLYGGLLERAASLSDLDLHEESEMEKQHLPALYGNGMNDWFDYDNKKAFFNSIMESRESADSEVKFGPCELVQGYENIELNTLLDADRNGRTGIAEVLCTNTSLGDLYSSEGVIDYFATSVGLESRLNGDFNDFWTEGHTVILYEKIMPSS